MNDDKFTLDDTEQGPGRAMARASDRNADRRETRLATKRNVIEAGDRGVFGKPDLAPLDKSRGYVIRADDGRRNPAASVASVSCRSDEHFLVVIPRPLTDGFRLIITAVSAYIVLLRRKRKCPSWSTLRARQPPSHSY
jgi:hypothetical protein